MSGSLTTDQAITQDYQNILQRAPDAAGLANWAAAVDSGTLTLLQVDNAIVASPEAQDSVVPIVELYTALGRAPDAAGLSTWVAAFEAGESLTSIADAFLSSPEGVGIYGSGAGIGALDANTAFITTVYQEVLGRLPDTAGQAAWTNALDNGTLTPAEVLVDILQSPEAAQRDATPVTNFLVAAGQGTADYGGSLFPQAGTTFTLTPGVDNIALTGNNNVVNGTANGSALTTPATFNTGDTITAAAGSTGNVLNLSDIDGSIIGPGEGWDPTDIAGVTVSGIQTLNLNSTEGVTANTASSIEGFTGLTALNVNDAGSTFITAAGTTDVAVTDSVDPATGSNGSVTVLGGDNITISSVDGAAVGGGTTATDPAGTVAVTDASSNGITIDGGTTISATETGGGDIVIGGTIAPTDTVTVNDTGMGSGDISVEGGTTVGVTATGQTTGSITIGDVTAPSGAVTVTDSGSYFTEGNGLGDINVTGGTSVAVTQTTGITAAQAAAAATSVNNGTEFLSDVTVTGDASTTSVSVTQAAAVPATPGGPVVVGTIGVVNGTDTISDVNASSLTAAGVLATVSLTGFGEGSSIDSSALTTINLSGTGTDLTVTDGALTTPNVTTQALNVDGLTTTGAVTLDPNITTLNLASSTAASTIESLVASGVTTLNISGDAAVALTNDTLGALTNVTVTDTAGVTLGSVLGDGVAFTGAGNDTITLGATTKAINLGGGNNTVNLTAALGTGGSINGTGTDTLATTAALAQTLSATSTSASGITGFETLSLSPTTTGPETVNLANLDNISNVISAGSGPVGTDAVDGFTFGNLAVGTSITIAGVTVTATGGTATASEIAAAFANGGTAGNATATGTLAGYTVAAGPANSGIDVFTSTTTGIGSPLVATMGGVASPAVPVATTLIPGAPGIVPEEDNVAFGALTIGQSVTVAGLTITDIGGPATAADVAAAVFSGTPTGLLTVSGALSGWTATTLLPGSVDFTETAPTDIGGPNISVGSGGNIAPLAPTPGFAPGTVGSALTLTNMASNGTLTLTGGGAVTVGMTDPSSATNSLNLDFTAATAFTAPITVAGVETLNITTLNTAATPTAPFVASIGDTSETSINVTGNVGIDLTDAGTAVTGTALTSFDASGVTGTGAAGAVTLTTGALAAAATLTGGAGNDTINAAAATKAVTLSDGSGNDTLTGSATVGSTITAGDGNDTIFGGSGGDIITVGNGNNAVIDGNGANTITVGTGSNAITLGSGTNTVTLGTHSATTADSISVKAATTAPGSFVPTAVITGLNASGADTITFTSDPTASAFTFYSTAQLDSFAAATGTTNPPTTLSEAVNDILSTVGGDLGPDAIGAFQFQNNTYLVDQAHAAGSAFGSGDTLVQLAGLDTFTTATTATNGVLHLAG